MIGIDHNTADISIREIFAWTVEKQNDVMDILKNVKGINGCIVLSTCNRMEIWISCDDSYDNLYNTFYKCLCIDKETYKSLFILRKDFESIEHLFRLACGLESKIMGEDQILTQIKDALVLARKKECTDNFLEVLFNLAIKIGKKVKTQVRLPRLNNSVVNSVINMLKGFHEINNRRCLVIGSGTIGKEVIRRLMNENANVTVAIRPNSNHLHIPVECEKVLLDDIYRILQNFDIVISTTLSSNYIIYKQMVENIDFNKKITFIDLAVPRDIEPTIAEIKNVVLYNIDDFQNENLTDSFSEYETEAAKLIAEGIRQYSSWVSNKTMLPIIEHIIQLVCEDNRDKTINIKKIKKDSLNENYVRMFSDSITKKTVKKILFEMNRYLPSDVYQECMRAIEKVYLQNSEEDKEG
ncbi:MAG: glutamyl-tRNA reductase [Eubacteriales bacterium]|nr:glutamyl-tRNA reductase [Eubacteriales bacterium]